MDEMHNPPLLSPSKPTFNLDTLHSQKLHIPNLWPAFKGWKRGINLAYQATTDRNDGSYDASRLKKAIDARLDELIRDDPIKLRKAKAVDLALFASCQYPNSPYHIVETVAFYNIWLFLWDDVIDGGTGEIGESAEAGRRYRDESVAFVRWCLFREKGERPVAPTLVCGSFEEVAVRVRAECDPICKEREGEMERFFESLKRYMDACVVEQAWRLSGVDGPPGEDEFWGWRLGTSSVDAMLDLSMILNEIEVSSEIVQSKEIQSMRLDVNKLLVSINELFSLKKELKDGTANLNLIPITMYASKDPLDLVSATSTVINNIYRYARDFEQNASILRTGVGDGEYEQVLELEHLIRAYQAVVTSVLTFSLKSPRYGVGENMQEDGGFVVAL